MSQYQETTQAITIEVQPIFLNERSSKEDSRYVWAYTVLIRNGGDETVQLLSRYWHITDGFGRVEEVMGDGVVGEQPIISPGKSWQYTSGCPLSTPSGIMVGHYIMENTMGKRFKVAIPAFSLDCPWETPSIN